MLESRIEQSPKIAPGDPLALAAALTRRTRAVCMGLERGEAEILDRVTPVTAQLLCWWFAGDACRSRDVNFSVGQRQAILNVIVAHEMLDSPDILDLYSQLCADALLDHERLAEVVSSRHAHPRYCLKMAIGTGKTWVLQALLIWQLLNKTAAIEEGRSDPRFTRNFLIVAPGLIVYKRLLDVFLGREGDAGARNSSTSDIAGYAELFVPPAQRERIGQFVRGNACAKTEIGLKVPADGLLAITHWQALVEGGKAERNMDASPPGLDMTTDAACGNVLPLIPARARGGNSGAPDHRPGCGNALSFLARLPDLMVFNDEAHRVRELECGAEAADVEWQRSLATIAAGKARRFAQVDFAARPYNIVGEGKVYFPHIVLDCDL